MSHKTTGFHRTLFGCLVAVVLYWVANPVGLAEPWMVMLLDTGSSATDDTGSVPTDDTGSPSSGDTGGSSDDTGGSSDDTGGSSDDTGSSSDDTGAGTDDTGAGAQADTGTVGQSAAELAGEKGGCGCSASPRWQAGSGWVLAFMFGLCRRRRNLR